MSTAISVAAGVGIYVCPTCKHVLEQEEGKLHCAACSETYPVHDRIPDFVREELWKSADPELRRMTAIDRMASIYETRLWYPVVLNVYGGFRSPSLPQLIEAMLRNVQPANGRLLDIACGPGTFGRRAASPSKEVFGIDVSNGMLRQGTAYAAKEGIPNIHFARARVEALPFEDAFFEASICCGSLHLFTDTVVALREIGRVLKPGAILSGFTFTNGTGGILKHRRVREWYVDHGLHVFELPEIERYLTASGFEGFQPEVAGSILMFSARRRRA